MRWTMGLLAAWLSAGCVLSGAGTRSGAASDGDADGDADADSDADSDADGDSDGDGCAAEPEACNGLDDDCDGLVDEDFDLAGDPANCGRCGLACPTDPANAASSCVSGRCVLRCNPGFDDCDGEAPNGCEASLSARETCGSCETACGGQTPVCLGSLAEGFRCGAACPAGTADCGGSCVDTESDPSHCGGCDRACPEPANARPTCEAGECAFECDELWDDCAGGGDDGCETSLQTATDCGACDVACTFPHASATCPGGECTMGECDEGWGDCARAAPGCETDLGEAPSCGACGETCERDHATTECDEGTCRIVECDPFFADCRNGETDGCETDLLWDDDYCGSCTMRCMGATSCVGGVCAADICPPTCDCDATCSTSDPCDCAAGCDCIDLMCASDCAATCSGAGTICHIDATSISNFNSFSCNGGAVCSVDLTGSGGNFESGVVCSGSTTACHLICEDVSNCYPTCNGGARCLLDCTDTTNCGFSPCDGVLTDCGGDLWACNAPCP